MSQELLDCIQKKGIHIPEEILHKLKCPPNNKDKISFIDVIKNNSPFTVIEAPTTMIDYIKQQLAEKLVGTELKDVRINENGNKTEDRLIDIHPDNFQRPRTVNNKKQSAGYPDLIYGTDVKDKNTLDDYIKSTEAYVEVKLYKEGTQDSSFRAFYMSSFTKITKSCPHLLIGFSHDGKKIRKVDVIDLYHKVLNVKIEYHMSNKEIYPQIEKPKKPKKPKNTPIPATYTLEQIGEIHHSNKMTKSEKRQVYKEIIDKHKLTKCGKSAKKMYESLIKHFQYSEEAKQLNM
uniref:Uncharacterized protein n=1 Tax=viral metagenome TaxID=1070528 RepID=A0A6C0F801_9ZZZZ